MPGACIVLNGALGCMHNVQFYSINEKGTSILVIVLLCGLSGFSDFYKPEWLNQIISWQDPVTGCYGEIENNEDSENADNENNAPKRNKRRDRTFLAPPEFTIFFLVHIRAPRTRQE
ncbi:hypothetical protein GDO81_020912 [Engystomops pustulosus]|uniref:Uncharacterized protein n=1 Tax=Engystomops pustulosus TaxID=76066 RepID=A0AAV6YQK1_ENGPU|nr:hypothetical protein GDO81_020912 [Engystomops pustulosus]